MRGVDSLISKRDGCLAQAFPGLLKILRQILREGRFRCRPAVVLLACLDPLLAVIAFSTGHALTVIMPKERLRSPTDPFEKVRKAGLALPDVTVTTTYDGSPVLKVGGSFMAGLAMHRSAEPETLVVRVGLEERAWLLEDAPQTYYVTDYYRSYPVVLVRLAQIDLDALRDMLSVSWRLALAKGRQHARKKYNKP